MIVMLLFSGQRERALYELHAVDQHSERVETTVPSGEALTKSFSLLIGATTSSSILTRTHWRCDVGL
ncbi:hypothetical protein GN958_ATG18744 [Phytophthora infestans]|uniref:Uncharacterized protein n=1 Tax=Phytophthora infestans TaxID=4787 RepID=A0A8S9TZH9_PHYIN|nr:hypothetical protein GN958_ATG18744 [Phytophthora infestans]